MIWSRIGSDLARGHCWYPGTKYQLVQLSFSEPGQRLSPADIYRPVRPTKPPPSPSHTVLPGSTRFHPVPLGSPVSTAVHPVPP
eukprot:3364515-Prymnesium_polylepis.1